MTQETEMPEIGVIADIHFEITNKVIEFAHNLCARDAHLANSVLRQAARYSELMHTNWYYRQVQEAKEKNDNPQE